jgi:heme-degrading monooxygenase HmoA
MYISVSRLRVHRDALDDLIRAFRNRLGAVDGFDGFCDLEVWSSDRDAGEVLMVSRWRDRASFTAYMRSEAHRVSHARVPKRLDDAIALQRLDHMHTYDVVAR